MDEKKIVIINQDSGYLMIDLAHAYLANGYQVKLITGRLVERNNKLDYRVKVTKIISYDRSTTFKRLFSWLIGAFQILYLIKSKFKKDEILFVSNPPFTPFVAHFIKNDFSFLIYDIYPDLLIDFKVFTNDSIIVKKWKKINSEVLKRSKRIFTLNENMKGVLGAYVKLDKIEVIPIWTDNEFLKPIIKGENPYIKELGLENKFIILYSGNLGKSHAVEKLLDLAELLPEEPFYFLIIGGGEKFKLIEEGIENRNIRNMQLLPWQSVEKLPFSLATADLGVVTLGKETSNLSIPSKTFNLMSVGVPIMSISSNQSALSNLVKLNNIGANFVEEELEQMKEFIQLLKADKKLHNKLKSESYKLSKKFTVENALKFIEKIVKVNDIY